MLRVVFVDLDNVKVVCHEIPDDLERVSNDDSEDSDLNRNRQVTSDAIEVVSANGDGV